MIFKIKLAFWQSDLYVNTMTKVDRIVKEFEQKHASPRPQSKARHDSFDDKILRNDEPNLPPDIQAWLQEVHKYAPQRDDSVGTESGIQEPLLPTGWGYQGMWRRKELRF